MQLPELLDEPAFTEANLAAIKSAIQKSIQENGRCVIGLSGGKTPVQTYTYLGQDASIDWNSVYVFLTDERYVPADHEDSNQRMIIDTLLSHAMIPAGNLHFPNTALPIRECISHYDKDLASLLREPADVVVLGFGGDGHIASLFPPLSEEAFGPAYVIHTETDAFAVHDRISTTLPVLASAKERIVLLKGPEKIDAWKEMSMDNADERFWPLKAVMETGEVKVIAGK